MEQVDKTQGSTGVNAPVTNNGDFSDDFIQRVQQIAKGGLPRTGLEIMLGRIEPENPWVLMEGCAPKAVMGGLMGGVMGGLMGLVLGGYGSIAPPVSIPGMPDPPKIPMKWQMRESWISTARRSRRWFKNFGSVTVVFSGVECVIEKYRGKHDIVNGVSAGCITGGALAAPAGPAAMCFGCVGFAAFSAAIEAIMH